MAESKIHYVGQLQRQGFTPENIELFVNARNDDTVRTTIADATFYVDATNGGDGNRGTVTEPFKTIQRAIDEVPRLIKRGFSVVIELADDTYSTNYLAAADMPRPAIAYVTDIYAGERSFDSSGLKGSLVIRGESEAGTIIETGATYTYGIYASQIPNIAIENLTIRGDGSNTAAALVTAHRNCYVQMKDVTINGQSDTTNGAVCESGGIMEIIGGSEVKNCTTNCVSFDESLLVLSNTTTSSGSSSSALGGRGTITLNNTVDIQDAISTEGTTIISRGTNTSNRVTIKGNITGYNVQLYSVWTDFSGALIDLSGSDVQFNVCSWSDQIIMRSGSIRLRGATTSYISPATSSDVANPLALLGDAQLYMDSAATINGSGSVDNAIRGVLTQNVTANSTTINFQAQAGRIMQTELTANGSYTGCSLATSSNDFSQPPNEGDVWHILFRGSNDVALVDSTTADIATGGITLGLASTKYNGITFVWRSDRLWHEIGRSGAN